MLTNWFRSTYPCLRETFSQSNGKKAPELSGGRRENDKVISVHAGAGMTIGGLHSPLPEQFCNHIKAASAGISYRLTWEDNMDA